MRNEFATTRSLWELCPDFVPKLVAVRKEWNAWLTEHSGDPLPDLPNESELVSVARRMAQLQLRTIGETAELLALGAFDQRLPALRSHIDAVIAYLIEAMGRQRSTKAAPLSRHRLLESGRNSASRVFSPGWARYTGCVDPQRFECGQHSFGRRELRLHRLERSGGWEPFSRLRAPVPAK